MDKKNHFQEYLEKAQEEGQIEFLKGIDTATKQFGDPQEIRSATIEEVYSILKENGKEATVVADANFLFFIFDDRRWLVCSKPR